MLAFELQIFNYLPGSGSKITEKHLIYRTMKTKTLVSAMALPLLLVACSQDEFVSQSTNLSQDGRKVVENVTINFEEPATRLTIDGVNYKWEEGDVFGASLMDEFKSNDLAAYPNDAWWNQFTLKDYIQTNYPFTRGAGENAGWTSEAVMQEGNYFFYLPYNSNLGGKRTPIQMEMPTEQYVDPSKPTDVLGDQLFVAYAPVYADEEKEHESLSLKMQPLLAFPVFNLKNVGTGSLTIKRIAFIADDGFSKILEVKPAEGKFSGKTFLTYTKDEDQRDALKGIVEYSQKEIAEKITAHLGEEGYVLGSQKDVSIIMLIPESDTRTGGEYKNPKLYIYSDAGLAIADLSTEHKDGGKKDGVTNITNDRKLTEVEYNDGARVNITFDNTSFAQPGDMIVSSTADLEDLVEWSAENTDATAVLTAEIQGDNVEISKKVCELMNANEKLNLAVTTADGEKEAITVTIPADASANALDRIAFNNVNVINKANLTVAENFGFNDGEKKTGIVELTNEEGASITLSGNSYGLTQTNVVNKGTITFKAANGKAMSVTAGNAPTGTEITIENTSKGTMVVATNVNVNQGGIINKGTFTLNEKVELTARIVNGATESKDGVINVNGKWTLNFQTGANYGIINVAKTGTIVVPQGAVFTNCYNTIYSNGALVYQGRIINDGYIYGVMNSSTPNVGMALIVINNNAAVLESAAGSTGMVDNTKQSPYVQKVAGETMYANVSGDYKASEIKKIVSASNANLLYLSGTITIDPEESDTEVAVIGEQETLSVIAVDDLTIKATKAGDKVWFGAGGTTGTENATFEVNAGTTDLTTGAKLGFQTGTVTVKEGAKLLIQAGAEILCGSDKPTSSNVVCAGTWTKNN